MSLDDVDRINSNYQNLWPKMGLAIEQCRQCGLQMPIGGTGSALGVLNKICEFLGTSTGQTEVREALATVYEYYGDPYDSSRSVMAICNAYLVLCGHCRSWLCNKCWKLPHGQPGCTLCSPAAPQTHPVAATTASSLKEMATETTTLYAFFVHAEVRPMGTVVDTASDEKWVAGIRHRANWPDSPVRIVREGDWNPPKLQSLAPQHIMGTLQCAVADGIPKYLASKGVRQMSPEQVANNSLGCIENPTTALLVILIKA